MKINNNDVLEKIYAETRALIFTFGAKGWTMDTICQKSGVAKDTLYRIISTKEELIQAVLLQEVDMHMEKIIRQLKNDDEYFDTLKIIVALLSDFLGKFSPEKLSRLFLDYPAIEKAVKKRIENSYSYIEEYLNKGKKLGNIKDEVDTKLLINIIHVGIMQFIEQPQVYSATKDTEAFLNYLFWGIGCKQA